MLLSIKPEYVNYILEGTKQYEFRKKRCKNNVDSILIYCTYPVMKIVGEAEIDSILEGNKKDVWNKTKGFGGVSYQFYCQYYLGRDVAVAYKLKNIRRFAEPRDLSYYGVKSAPQSFVYIPT